MKQTDRKREIGGVSIFIVIFSALLITIVTVSFVSVMIRSQQQASSADLSNSAYDSALAGVEDGKRLLLIYRDCLRPGSDRTTPACQNAISAIDDPAQPCNTVKKGLYGVNDTNEVLVQRQQSGDDTSGGLDQAYTCAKITYLASNIEGSLTDGGSKLIPLEASTPFDTIKISWFKRDQGSTELLGAVPPSIANTFLLPTKTSANWPSNAASLLRAQFMQVASPFNVKDFEQATGAASNTNTLFLYPVRVAGPRPAQPSKNFLTSDAAIKSPTPSICANDAYVGGRYACEETITVPQAIGGTQKSAFLQLDALYNSADYRIELFSGNTPIGVVAPVIDSTGRSSDLFRRVSARIDFSNDYPQAAMTIQGNLCKNFSVTSDSAGYSSGSPVCNP